MPGARSETGELRVRKESTKREVILDLKENEVVRVPPLRDVRMLKGECECRMTSLSSAESRSKICSANKVEALFHLRHALTLADEDSGAALHGVLSTSSLSED